MIREYIFKIKQVIDTVAYIINTPILIKDEIYYKIKFKLKAEKQASHMDIDDFIGYVKEKRYPSKQCH